MPAARPDAPRPAARRRDRQRADGDARGAEGACTHDLRVCRRFAPPTPRVRQWHLPAAGSGDSSLMRCAPSPAPPNGSL